MRFSSLHILFGPEHDALHVDPAAPGAYEWWYFDALSDDGRWALVVIFFLGTPMSPYYKAVASGGKPDPRDWCGMFVSLHENSEQRWRERAYAYNLYRGGEFSARRCEVAVGGSRFGGRPETGGAWTWTLAVSEPGLWRGRTEARLAFAAPGPPLDLPALGAGTAHGWVCVAPLCRVTGTITPPTGRPVVFAGTGYHDHNFGRLPFGDTEIWYWGRAVLGPNGGTAVFYHREPPEGGGTGNSTLLLQNRGGAPVVATDAATLRPSEPQRSPYGLRHARQLDFGAAGHRVLVRMEDRSGALLEGPFYRRLPLTIRVADSDGETRAAAGIGEVFRPAKLCGPIASRAMWSRIRRRKT